MSSIGTTRPPQTVQQRGADLLARENAADRLLLRVQRAKAEGAPTVVLALDEALALAGGYWKALQAEKAEHHRLTRWTPPEHDPAVPASPSPSSLPT